MAELRKEFERAIKANFHAGGPQLAAQACLAVVEKRIKELETALERSVKAGERVLAAMDAHNEKHETHYGGSAFFEIGRAVAQGRAALPSVVLKGNSNG